MAGWLAELIRRESWQASSIIPVPLGRVRMRERGYNQAKLIAEGLADRIELPISDDILIRVKDTRSQVGLDPLARRRNVENAFQARPFSQAAKSVFLIDDLVTTGSTLLACASALMEAGVKKVYGLAVARA
jgi:ComF family protein